jgi:prepilin-type N-terminal cleavage/methylation domain-containing protein
MFSRKMNMQRNKGFTLAEVAIAVAVGALLLIGLAITPKILADNRSSAEIQELSLITSNGQKAFSTSSTYAGATTTLLIARNVFPAARVTNATTANNRWGGSIAAAAGTTTTANDSLTLTYTNIPSIECQDVVIGASNVMLAISVDGTAVETARPQTLNQGTLATQCNSTTTNTIVYTFSK